MSADESSYRASLSVAQRAEFDYLVGERIGIGFSDTPAAQVPKDAVARAMREARAAVEGMEG